MLDFSKSSKLLYDLPVYYLTAIPKKHHFNALNGTFNKENESTKTLSFIPTAHQFFEHKLFEKDKPDLYAELYFYDEKGEFSTIMFRNSSAKALRKLCEELYYENLRLTQITLNISSTEKISQNNEKWYLAEFNYERIIFDDSLYPF